MKNKNILFVGEWLSANLGDQVLCSCVYEIVQRFIPTANLMKFDSSFGNGFSLKKRIGLLPHRVYYKINKNIDKRTENFNNIKRNWIISDLQNIKESIDLIIICGGQMFLDYFADNLKCICDYANKKSIPIFWNSVGGGKCSERTISIFKECIHSNSSKLLTIRDNLDFFREILKVNAHLVPDPAIFSSQYFPANSVKQETVGLGIMNPSAFKDFKVAPQRIRQFWIDVISQLENRKISWELFTNGSSEDADFLSTLLPLIKVKNIRIAAVPLNGLDLINLVTKYSKIISFRLHSHIIAYSYKVPSFGIIWDNKVLDFFDFVGNSNNYMFIKDLNISKVTDFVEKGNSNFSQLEYLQNDVKNSIIDNINRIIHI